MCKCRLWSRESVLIREIIKVTPWRLLISKRPFHLIYRRIYQTYKHFTGYTVAYIKHTSISPDIPSHISNIQTFHRIYRRIYQTYKHFNGYTVAYIKHTSISPDIPSHISSIQAFHRIYRRIYQTYKKVNTFIQYWRCF